MKNMFFLKINKGFTLVELIVVISLLSILLSFGGITLLRSESSSTITSTTDTIIADLRNQQIKAMVGNTEGRSTASEYGIHFDSNQYVLFHGLTYTPSDSTNRVIEIANALTFDNILLPCGNIIFSRISGEMSEYSQGADSIRLFHTTSKQQKTITFNRYGVIISVN